MVALNVLDHNKGAVVLDVDLSVDLTDAEFAEIRAAYRLYSNLVIPNQSHITPEAYIRFCSRFGRMMTGVPATSRQSKYSSTDVNQNQQRKYTLDEHPEIFIISNAEQGGKPTGLSKAGLYWHSDLYYKEIPAKTTFLMARQVPADGGDTLFLNSYEVYEQLPPAMKARLEGLRVWHSWTAGWPYTFPTRSPLSPEERSATPDVEHPLICRHPETGRKYVYVGALYKADNPGIRFLGLDEAAGQALYRELRAFMLQDRFVYRHKWSVGDIVASDNLTAMHCATPFDDVAQIRTLHRVTIEGEPPLAA